jgi:hypothetical protein
MLNRRALTSVVVALATTIATQSFAQDRGTGATPAVGANAGATPRLPAPTENRCALSCSAGQEA